MADKRTADILAENVRRLRRDRGWTQIDLAERLDWQQSRVSAVERCTKQFGIGILDELCEAFGVTQSELLAPIGEPQETAA